MKALIQRVSSASVSVDDKQLSSIKSGMLILLGIHKDDTEEDLEYLVAKISQLRIFSDEQDKMNLSITDANSSILLVSQFTLHSRTRKGNRPSFIDAAGNDQAHKFYDQMKTKLSEVTHVETGQFGAYMMIDLTADGPVTIMIDSRNKK